MRKSNVHTIGNTSFLCANIKESSDSKITNLSDFFNPSLTHSFITGTFVFSRIVFTKLTHHLIRSLLLTLQNCVPSCFFLLSKQYALLCQLTSYLAHQYFPVNSHLQRLSYLQTIVYLFPPLANFFQSFMLTL